MRFACPQPSAHPFPAASQNSSLRVEFLLKTDSGYPKDTDCFCQFFLLLCPSITTKQICRHIAALFYYYYLRVLLKIPPNPINNLCSLTGN